MPAPGSSSDGYLLQLFATDRFCFIHHDAGAATAGRTCRDNGGIKIAPGPDVASHLNIVTSFPRRPEPFGPRLAPTDERGLHHEVRHRIHRQSGEPGHVGGHELVFDQPATVPGGEVGARPRST